MADLFYSFGARTRAPSRCTTIPKHLQNLTRDDGEHLDLAAVDIFRDRERGVPRYNQFRRLLHKDPVKSFEELTDNPAWREEIRKVYGNDLEKVDLMTGLYAEPLPPGFGFSETAFRIFVLMASRRLKSDRFFTDDYRAEMYTRVRAEVHQGELDADGAEASLSRSGAGASRRGQRVQAVAKCRSGSCRSGDET